MKLFSYLIYSSLSVSWEMHAMANSKIFEELKGKNWLTGSLRHRPGGRHCNKQLRKDG